MAQIILDSNNNLIQGDFDNATLNNRTKLQTTTTNATTNVYVVPNGSSTSAGVSVANNSSLTNASKIVMATNGSTDTQIISGVNGSGTYLPMSFYVNNTLALQISTAGVVSAPYGGFSGAGPVLKFVTDSTDIAVTADPSSSYYNVGSSFSVSIPTTGIIRISSFIGRVQNNTNSAGGGPTFGIRIGTTNYWLGKGVVQVPSTTTRYVALLIEGYAVGSTYIESYGALSSFINAEYSKSHVLDIAYSSLPTGSQTVQLICAKTNYVYTDNFTLKGTAITTKVGIEFVSAS